MLGGLFPIMSFPANTVTIQPHFKAHPGQTEAFRALTRAFVAKTKPETLNLFYDFTSNGDEFFCREGYLGAEGALVHLQNVGALVEEGLKIADLTRLEIHCPAGDL